MILLELNFADFEYLNYSLFDQQPGKHQKRPISRSDLRQTCDMYSKTTNIGTYLGIFYIVSEKSTLLLLHTYYISGIWLDGPNRFSKCKNETSKNARILAMRTLSVKNGKKYSENSKMHFQFYCHSFIYLRLILICKKRQEGHLEIPMMCKEIKGMEN